MRYKQGQRRKPIEYEKDVISYWKQNKLFEKSVEFRPADKTFVFYDGPPFITGTPHHGHLLISTLKDAVARYWTMKGYRVERRWGWDCHGLPAEVFVEKKLGINNKKEIGTKISIEDYVKECRDAMVKHGTEWEDIIDRIGRWVEFEGAYKTMDKEYMESVWWAFKELYDNGKIYEGEKILVYCTKDATPISKSEVAMENSYQMDSDPSVYVYFKLEDRDEYVLAWTTTPWTLPANVAIAVNTDLDYTLIEHEGKKFYVGTEALDRVMTNEKHQPLSFTKIKEVKGRDLVGLKYEPLFQNQGTNAHRVLSAEFVGADTGTGIVHEAPAYGEEDYELCKKENVPIVSIVDENGHYTEGRWIGENIWDINKEIAKTLVSEGNALKVEYIRHEYPHCHRCGTKLMYRAHPSWFVDIQAQKQQMLEANETTNWNPKHLQEGRFKNILETAPDWNISRDRYWATPLPVWKGVRNDGTEVIKVIGSYEEFEKLTGLKLNDYHLPQVMNVEFEYDGTTLKHIGKVIDCWFESGSMPFAQFHYPFENKEKFENSFPADFITEAIDQTRGWFYSLTAVNVGLFNKSPFVNLICTGHINAADGRKLSKKLGNYTDPMILMDNFSADSFRYLMLTSPLVNGESFALTDREVGDVLRKLNMVWNMYDFFTMYADVDNWDSGLKKGELPKDPSKDLDNILDLWIVSKLHLLIKNVTESMDKYNITDATKPLFEFLDDASNWYVRRSRKRFWKSDNDKDKDDAYRTLHYVLSKLSVILAPFAPFMAEELYMKLTEGDSVHLLDWPEVGEIHSEVIETMDLVREYINEGLSVRAQKSVKVRQPLQSVTLKSDLKNTELSKVISEELNVKVVLIDTKQSESIKLDLNITDELRQEGLMRELIRNIQQARKEAGLIVDDRIKLFIDDSSEKVKELLTNSNLVEEIKNETLTEVLAKDNKLKFVKKYKLNDQEVELALEKH